MKYLFSLPCILLLAVCAFAQRGYEATYTVHFTDEKKEVRIVNVKVKDSLVYLRQTQGGNARYANYLLNLNTRDFFTVSKPEKKVVIKYNLDKLLALYEKENLKEGFTVQSPLAFKVTDKTKEEDGVKMTRYTAENDIHKASFWLSEGGFNFNQLIPLLRLLGNWNEAQGPEGTIMNAEVSNKVSKRESVVTVAVKKEAVSKDYLQLPKGYLQKDFARLIESERNNKDLKLIVKTFAGF